MRRDVDVGLVGAHVLERARDGFGVEVGGGYRDQRDVDAAGALHRRFLEVGDGAA
jgi:hypothetical protein